MFPSQGGYSRFSSLFGRIREDKAQGRPLFVINLKEITGITVINLSQPHVKQALIRHNAQKGVIPALLTVVTVLTPFLQPWGYTGGNLTFLSGLFSPRGVKTGGKEVFILTQNVRNLPVFMWC